MWVFLTLQNFLMGQKLHNITYHEDHDVLNKNLTPDPDPSSTDQDASGMFSVCEDPEMPLVPVNALLDHAVFIGDMLDSCNMR
jgi:hypothetical protein